MSTDNTGKRLAIIGGGPIGVEAALYGACAGYQVQLYERGRLGENVRQWGHVQLFTEWARNRSPLAVELLEARGTPLASSQTTSSGDELADYILQLATLEPLRGRIAPQTEVVSLTRERCLKSDFIDDPRRRDFPFRLALRGPFGEKIRQADIVIDATGVFATTNPMGQGGVLCVGEKECANRIDYHIPDVPGRDLKRFANKRTLVVGSGHSAASTLRSCGELFAEFSQTRVTWAVRRNVPEHGYPYTLVPNDTSPHRDLLHRQANDLTEHPNVDFRPRTVIESVRYDRVFRVVLKTWDAKGEHTEEVEFDNIAAHTGFRPDRTLWNELQVAVHPATDGPLNLSSAIVAQNRRAGTGLSTGYAEKEPQLIDDVAHDHFLPVAGGPDLLQSGEPDFYIIGIKSYGRDAGFLMQNGFRQVRDVFRLISDDPTFDLYRGVLDTALTHQNERATD
jgi:thioredoxin reductase